MENVDIQTTQTPNEQTLQSVYSPSESNITTVVQDVPQIQTVIQDNMPAISSVINAPFVEVTSVNGMTGDVITNAQVEEYRKGRYYTKNSVVTHNYSLYIALEDFTAGDFDPTQWQEVSSGGSGVQSDWNDNDTTSPAYIKNKPDLTNYVEKETGKGLSTNDYTTAEKSKLAGIENNAEVNKISTITVNGATQTPVQKNISLTIPVKTSDLTNDSGYITQAVVTLTNFYDKSEVDAMVSSAIKYKGSVATKSALPSNPSNGDLYYVEDEGVSYVWSSADSKWNKQSGEIDLSPYLTKTEASSTYVAQETGKGLSTNDYTTNEKTKLAGIATGAEVNVQSDWNTTDATADSYIKHKPSVPTKTSELTNDSDYQTGTQVSSALANKVDKVSGKGLSTNDYTTTEKNKLAGIASGAEVNVQPDWNQTNSSADDYIKNKPNIVGTSQSDWNTTDTADASYIKNKPTAVSAFTNDAGYLAMDYDTISDYILPVGTIIEFDSDYEPSFPTTNLYGEWESLGWTDNKVWRQVISRNASNIAANGTLEEFFAIPGDYVEIRISGLVVPNTSGTLYVQINQQTSGYTRWGIIRSGTNTPGTHYFENNAYPLAASSGTPISWEMTYRKPKNTTSVSWIWKTRIESAGEQRFGGFSQNNTTKLNYVKAWVSVACSYSEWTVEVLRNLGTTRKYRRIA